jgi:uncharacterized RDD family membrane protein YckC
MFPRGNTGPACRHYPDGMVRDGSPASQGRARGAALGLPAEGPGSIAPFSTRAVAFVVDALLAAVVAAAVVQGIPQNWSLLSFGLITAVSLVLVGRTPGQALLKLQLAHPRQGERVAPWRAVVRTALLMLLVPALVVDSDGRGLHDRITQTAVIRAV